jgi:energy-coupling factor transport system permease protein
MIGYRPGDSPLHRAHPYTPLALAVSLLLAVFALGSPGAVGAAVLAAVILAAAGGVLGYTARPAFVIGFTTWVLLLVLHGLLGPGPFLAAGPLSLSARGLHRALVLGGRLTTILVAFLTVLAVVSPARLVDAMTERGVAFAKMYLLVSTLTLVPRLRARAAQILEAQQCRGLRLGGSPLARVAALGPLVLPLVLGALAEVDEQVLALDARGAGRAGRRTALDPPADSALQRTVRWAALLVAAALFVAKVAERAQ